MRGESRVDLQFITVVEPHSDDAFLSLGGHIEAWAKEGKSVRIVTVYCDKKRAREARAYANAVGADHDYLLLKEGEVVRPGDLTPLLFGQAIFPLGIKHPDHRRVRVAAPFDTWLYLDTPYQSTQANGPEVNSLAKGLPMVSFLKPPSRKWRHIPLFKSQSLFFHYNPAEKLSQSTEIILGSYNLPF